jgi:hypothetical protein
MSKSSRSLVAANQPKATFSHGSRVVCIHIQKKKKLMKVTISFQESCSYFTQGCCSGAIVPVASQVRTSAMLLLVTGHQNYVTVTFSKA